MIRSKSNGEMRPPCGIGLFMECEEEELCPAQVEYYQNAVKEFENFNKQVDEYNKQKKGKIVIEDGGITLIESLMVNDSPVSPPSTQRQSSKIVQLNIEKAIFKTLPVAKRNASTVLGPKKTFLISKQKGNDVDVPVAATPVIISPPSPTSESVLTQISRNQIKVLPYHEKASEVTSLGGLTLGSGVRRPSVFGLPNQIKNNVANESDNEIVLSKSSEKTYASLLCVARPKLNAGSLSVNQSDRSVLDAQVKGFLMLPATHFCEWLLEKGLIRNQQFCPNHTKEKMSLVRCSAGGKKESNKFIFSGGYVWGGDCCRFTKLVSVFNGSIFESSPHPPTIILKLIYHWACQTNIPNVLHWVIVSPLYLRNFYSFLRGICVLSMYRKFDLMGGYDQKVELGFIHVRSKKDEAKSAVHRVETDIIGVLDTRTKRVRLRAVNPEKWNEEVIEFLKISVDQNSIICCDHSLATDEIIQAGFKNFNQHTSFNKTITSYLRDTVMRMFPACVPISSRMIIQQFLDELAWREFWGTNAMQAFNNIIAHIADFTAENPKTGIIRRVSKIGASPFFVQPPKEKQPKIGQKRPAEPPVIQDEPAVKKAADVKTSFGFANDVDWYTLKKVAISVEQAKLVRGIPTVPMEQYYYGHLRGFMRIDPPKHGVAIECTVCKQVFDDCMTLMAHIVLHYQTIPTISCPLSEISQCPECFIGFKNDIDLKVHENKHVLSPPYPQKSCQICEVKFSEQMHLFYHMFQCHTRQDYPYGCKLCGYRFSSFKKIINHIRSHQRERVIFCPYCLKMVTIISDEGSVIQSNLRHFTMHIRRHALGDVRCRQCRLRFLHASLLQEHIKKDHCGFADHPKAIRQSRTQILMPEPVAVKPLPMTFSKQYQYIRDYKCFTLICRDLFCSIPEGTVCLECEDYVDPGHFLSSFACASCSYSTNCQRAAADHYAVMHNPKGLWTVFPQTAHSMSEMYCPCGYSSTGNNLARHLVKCNQLTAYVSLPTTPVADELTVLNTVGLVRKSPEPHDQQQPVTDFVQNPTSSSNTVSVDSAEPDWSSESAPDTLPAGDSLTALKTEERSDPKENSDMDDVIFVEDFGKNKTASQVAAVNGVATEECAQQNDSPDDAMMISVPEPSELTKTEKETTKESFDDIVECAAKDNTNILSSLAEDDKDENLPDKNSEISFMETEDVVPVAEENNDAENDLSPVPTEMEVENTSNVGAIDDTSASVVEESRNVDDNILPVGEESTENVDNVISDTGPSLIDESIKIVDDKLDEFADDACVTSVEESCEVAKDAEENAVEIDSQITEETLGQVLGSVNTDATTTNATSEDDIAFFGKEATTEDILVDSSNSTPFDSLAEKCELGPMTESVPAGEDICVPETIENIPISLIDTPENEKVEGKEVTGSLIEELENMMDTAEPTVESPDFISFN